MVLRYRENKLKDNTKLPNRTLFYRVECPNLKGLGVPKVSSDFYILSNKPSETRMHI